MPRGDNSRNLPLSALDPRYRELLLRGARERIELPCSSEKQRNSLRNTLQSFRAKCKRESAPDWEQMYKAKLYLPRREAESSPWLIIIAPRGSEFDDVLTRATSTPVEPSTEPLSEDPLADVPAETGGR